MPDGVVIALISSCGVMLVGIIQWMSNRTTVKAAERREFGLKEQQAEQLRLEREERQKERDHALNLAAQERQHALTQAEAEYKRVTRERWKDTRVKAYESTIAATSALGRLAGEMFAELHLNKDAEVFEAKNTAFVRSLQEIIDNRAKVDLFGSELFGKKLTDFTTEAFQISAQASMVVERLEGGDETSGRAAMTMMTSLRRIMEAAEDMKRVAKKDLGTTD